MRSTWRKKIVVGLLALVLLVNLLPAQAIAEDTSDTSGTKTGEFVLPADDATTDDADESSANEVRRDSIALPSDEKGENLDSAEDAPAEDQKNSEDPPTTSRQATANRQMKAILPKTNRMAKQMTPTKTIPQHRMTPMKTKSKHLCAPLPPGKGPSLSPRCGMMITTHSVCGRMKFRYISKGQGFLTNIRKWNLFRAQETRI